MSKTLAGEIKKELEKKHLKTSWLSTVIAAKTAAGVSNWLARGDGIKYSDVLAIEKELRLPSGYFARKREEQDG